MQKLKCAAKLRRKDQTCGNPRGFRTDHPGVGKCWLHGGDTPVKHGLDSTVHRSRLADLIEKHQQNPDPTNLLPELAQLRAFAEDLMERWESIYGPDGALLAWHESFKNDPNAPAKPRQLPDFSAVSTVVDRVGAMVDRIIRHKKERSVTLEDLNRLLNLFGVEVVVAVREIGLDDDTGNRLIRAIESRWKTARLASE